MGVNSIEASGESKVLYGFYVVLYAGVEAIISFLQSKQLFVRTLLDHSPLLQNQNRIRILNGAETVCDHNRRSTLHKPFQCVLYQAFALIIQRTRRLVQDQDPWIPQQGSRNGDTLSLPNG